MNIPPPAATVASLGPQHSAQAVHEYVHDHVRVLLDELDAGQSVTTAQLVSVFVPQAYIDAQRGTTAPLEARTRFFSTLRYLSQNRLRDCWTHGVEKMVMGRKVRAWMWHRPDPAILPSVPKADLLAQEIAALRSQVCDLEARTLDQQAEIDTIRAFLTI